MTFTRFLSASARYAMVLLALFLSAVPVFAGETVTFFHNDIAGSPVLATDVNGMPVWRETYRPYGERLTQSPASAGNTLWFSGKQHDATTGLTYVGARYYDSLVGRFTGVDPVPMDFDNLHSVNRYAYANNNPYKFVDPDGHSPLDVAFLVYDVGKLGVALYNGVGVQGALLDVASSVVGVASPIPGTGQAIKAARAVDRGIDLIKAADAAGDAGRSIEKGAEFFRGAKAGVEPNFIPRPTDYKVDKATDLVKDTHGVSVFDNAASVKKKGFEPHKVDQSSVPDSLRIEQRGSDPHHYEIMPKPGANLTPEEFVKACSQIRCQ